MIELPYPPSSNRYWRHVGNKTLKSEEARNYQTTAGWLWKATGVDMLDGDVCVSLRIFRPQRRGDLDNRIKVLLDALNGIAYEDDGQVVELHAYLGDDKKNPRVELEVVAA